MITPFSTRSSPPRLWRWRLAASCGWALGLGFSSPAWAASSGDGADDSEQTEQVALKSERIVIVEPKETMDPEFASEQALQYMNAGITEWRGGDIEFAEKYFAAALGLPADVPEKETVLRRMAELYEGELMHSKAAAVLDRLATEFPNSRRLPETYMSVANLYRSMGAPELAISKYYMVLNSALNVSSDQLEKYKQLSLEAKIEIAETHKESEQYQESFRLYQSLFRTDLEPVHRLRVHYRMCFLLYELANYQKAVPQLKQFLEEYPESPHSPEIRYLLAKSYERLNRKPEALREVVNILQEQAEPGISYGEDADYWKQRMGNELANEFYETGDYRSALAIYQSLARYSAAPSWRWPAVHQIGLCFERLGLPEKAKLAYRQILEPEGDLPEVEALNENLRSLRQMAEWRLEHLNWEDDLVARLKVLNTR